MFFGLLSVLIVSYVHEIYSNTNIKPNIVVILVDDVGWNDFSYNSNHSLIRTTNIDRISSNGIRFKKHYVQSVCTPTRASLLTGRYAANVGLVYAMVPGTPTGIPHDIPTLPQLLRNEGYHTAMVGKWYACIIYNYKLMSYCDS
jgi:arylsulfatase A-like enzyme